MICYNKIIHHEKNPYAVLSASGVFSFKEKTDKYLYDVRHVQKLSLYLLA